jgi:hypothetical protein
MVKQYNKILEPAVLDGISMRAERYSNLDTNFRDFAENRSASFKV